MASRITLENDSSWNDFFVDFSATGNRVGRLGCKQFERTGNYFFIKVFKPDDSSAGGPFYRRGYVGLTPSEFASLIETGQRMLNEAAVIRSEQAAQPPPPPPVSPILPIQMAVSQVTPLAATAPVAPPEAPKKTRRRRVSIVPQPPKKRPAPGTSHQ